MLSGAAAAADTDTALPLSAHPGDKGGLLSIPLLCGVSERGAFLAGFSCQLDTEPSERVLNLGLSGSDWSGGMFVGHFLDC